MVVGTRMDGNLSLPALHNLHQVRRIARLFTICLIAWRKNEFEKMSRLRLG